jgi:ferritin-like metal-binding protein YciE
MRMGEIGSNIKGLNLEGAAQLLRSPHIVGAAERRTAGFNAWRSSMATEDETLRTIFVTGLKNAHAMEAQATELLERQIDRLDDYPELKTRLQDHLNETHRQQERIDRILGGLGESASTLKDTAMSLFGNMAAAAHMPASDEVLKNSFASFAFENYETAAYKSLIAMAESAGASDAVAPLKQSCAEEEAMASWLDGQLDSVTHKYLSRSVAEAARA